MSKLKPVKKSLHSNNGDYFSLLYYIPGVTFLILAGLSFYLQNLWLFLASLLLLLQYLPIYFIWKKEQKSFRKLQQVNFSTKSLIDNAHDMVIEHDQFGNILSVNRLTQELLGYSQKELLAMKMSDLDPNPKDKYVISENEKLQQGDSIKTKTRWETQNKIVLPVEIRTRITDWHDESRLVSIVRDISEWEETEMALEHSRKALERARNRLETRVHQRARELKRQINDRKRAEKDVNQMREFFYAMFDSMPSSIIALDSQQQILHWNRQAEILTGMTATDVTGKPISIILPEFIQYIEKFSEPGGAELFPTTERIEGIIGDERRQLDVMVYPLLTTGSGGLVIRVDDVTEKARIEDVLVQTEKMMSLGGLAAGMAHEINNPLGAVLQSSQNLRRRLGMDLERNQKIAQSFALDSEAFLKYIEKQRIYQLLETIDEGGKRAATIVEDMLSFARPGGQQNQLIDVCEVLDSSVRLAHRDYSTKKLYDFRSINILKDYQQSVPKVMGKSNRLQQVFLNLLTNAAQALSIAKVESATIYLRVYVEKYHLVVQVSDNGPGMSENVSRRIFEPFFSTKAEGSGTGLGLSVSYFIITEQMGGVMEVESKSGQGATFTIRIPIDNENTPKGSSHYENEQVQFDLPLSNSSSES